MTLGKDSGEKSKEGSRKESEYRRDNRNKERGATEREEIGRDKM